MERCVFCQGPYPPGTTFCPACGERQPTTDYIPPEGASTTSSLLTDDDADWGEQTLAAQPEAATSEERMSQEFVYHEFPASQEITLAPASDTPPGSTRPLAALAAPRPRKSHRKLIAILLAVLIVLGAGGTTAYILTRPAPVISLTGPQQRGSLPAGSPDLYFQVTGSDFSANSSISFLLDDKAAPGAARIQSDQHGAFQFDLLITDDWLLGQHTLTAKDAQGYLTKNGVRLMIVAVPVMSVASQYVVGSLPVGSTGTTLTYSGKRFALQSAITLLLDGKPLASVSPITSDARGRISGTIPVTTKLAVGSHTLTAQDARGNLTQLGAEFLIVTQGEGGTPGPNGAPADDLSFGAYARVSAKTADGQSYSFTQTLTITGNLDPAGGIVCSDQDDGQPVTYTGTLGGGSTETYTETITFTCRGTYKHGRLIYIEIGTSDKFVLGNGVRCASSGPYIYGAYDGSFTSATTMKGVYYSDYFQANCTDGNYIYRASAAGTWTGGI